MADGTVDYAALAKQAGAIDSTPAPVPATGGRGGGAPAAAPTGGRGGGVSPIDYTALAKQAGATSSTPAAPAPGGETDRGSAIGRAARGYYDRTLGPVIDTIRHPIDSAVGAIKTVIGADDLQLIHQALKTGNYKTAATLAGKYVAEGPQGRLGSAQVDPIVDAIQKGDYARAAGMAGGTITSLAAGAAAERIPATTRVGGMASKLNPVEQSGIDMLRNEGVPISPGTATGNRFVRSAEAVTRHSPLGAETAEDFSRGTEQGLQRVSGELAGEVSGGPATPASAGKRVETLLKKNIGDLQVEEGAGYKRAWKGRDDPQFTQEVPVRAAASADDKPVMAKVNMPVEVTGLKEMLAPVWDDMQWMPAAEQSSSAGFQAVKKIINGDDFIPAWQAEKGLSGLKTMARTDNVSGVRNVSQGIGAHVVPYLQDQIDAAVAATGDDAIRGLQKGRALHASKMEVAEIADNLRKEPVQTFNKMVWKNDTGVEYLKKVQEHAPDAIPQIARAYVDQIFDQATREGGFQKARTILSQWNDLGDQTKAILFPDGALRSRLDSFFKGAEVVGRQINSSGTALVNSATSVNPLRWAAGYAGSKLLFSPRGSRILTDGLKIPLGGPRAALAAGAMRSLLGPDAGAQQEPQE